MVLRYLESTRLNHGHSSGVTALAFSARATHIASAGLDGKVCIWNPLDGRLLHVFSSPVPVLSLTWVKPSEDTVICGLQDGTVVSLVIGPVDLVVAGFWAHSYPVECLSVTGSLLASGAHEEVRVWKGAGSEWSQVTELQGPPKASFNRTSPIIVTSLCWIASDSKDSATRLLVAYLNHGVHVYDTLTWDQIRSIPIPGQIADASVSLDAKHIVISNMIAGFDVYSLELGHPVCSFGHTVREYRKVPVIFIHEGLAIAGGNIQGDVHLWDVHSGRKLHSLLHQKDDQILALAAHYDPISDTFMIATGVLDGTSGSSTFIWKAKELGQSTPFPNDVHGRDNLRITYMLLSIIIVLVAAFAYVALDYPHIM
ncbi:WD40-repeat-containing domain protein [Trametes gibbosa]|nr:WD40-repeat-containing domain protein [Trametes gibbosa]